MTAIAQWLCFSLVQWVFHSTFAATDPFAEAPPWRLPVALGLEVLAWWTTGAIFFGWLYKNLRIGAYAGIVLAAWPLVSSFVALPLTGLLHAGGVVGRQGVALTVGLVQGLLLGLLFGGGDLWASRREKHPRTVDAS